jgi:hypothetical protein
MRSYGRLWLTRREMGTLVSFALLLLGPLLQVQGRLEQQKLGLSKPGLLGDGSEPLGMLAIQSRLIGVRRAHGS